MPALSLDQVQIDSQNISFTGENVKVVTFADAFSSAPQVVAISKGSAESVNVWTSGITQTQVSVHISTGWTGNILVQAIGRK